MNEPIDVAAFVAQLADDIAVDYALDELMIDDEILCVVFGLNDEQFLAQELDLMVLAELARRTA